MQLLTPRSRPPSGVGLGRAGEQSGAECTRTLLAGAFGPLIAGYAFVVALFAIVTAMASTAQFSVLGVLRAAGPGLLAAYQVPVSIGGSPLGVLPLLGTAGVCALVAGSAAQTAGRLGYHEPGQAVNVVAPVAAAHALLGVLVALTVRGAGVTVEPLAAFLVPGFVSAVAATAGVANRCGFAATARAYLDPVALRGLRAGALGMAGLFAAGALVFTVSLALSLGTAHDLFLTNAPGFGSGAGMLLLSLGYLPNAVVSALAFTVGPGFSIGPVSMTPFTFTGGAVPGLPLLAGMPQHPARWWPMLMLLPAAVGALVGWDLRGSAASLLARLRTVGIAGALIGFGCVVLGTLSGGRLGSGSFNPVSIPVGLMSVAAFGMIVVPGGLMAWLAGPRGHPSEPSGFSDDLPEAFEEDGEPAEDQEWESDIAEAREADEPEHTGNEGDTGAEELPPTSEEPEEPS